MLFERGVNWVITAAKSRMNDPFLYRKSLHLGGLFSALPIQTEEEPSYYD
jgi:hypothetical protein